MNGKNNSLISTQLITASLTMITVVSVFAVFIIDKREVGILYYIITGFSFFSFVLSIICGGIGLSSENAESQYNKYFNYQTRTALLGIVLFCTSIFLGNDKENATEQTLKNQEKTIIELQLKDGLQSKEIDDLKSNIERLSKQLESTNSRLDTLTLLTEKNKQKKK
ncbi:hypothetical protein ACFOUP_14695 [Belliella kenyensis]|uniref:Uncharacterized protein n=1 Tax=Belliella kenyensis TaxID=1472724 RepID=A0ABV8ERL0_9BACT|nr:hypothetical protein [Belliella kenyensis]MCH7401694.1 hypothetical protein [Belliella kenyensis]MDN3603028.1 hypothetical protein [Belliella kenyensis]